jgi:DNA-binding MarR family transcriptional regulator
MLRQDFDRYCSELNITRSQWTMIAVVNRRPGATQRQIAEITEMSEASAGRLIDRLCADGLLERREADNDRRARAVYLTDAATPLLEKLSQVAKDREDRVFRDFAPDELNSFRDSLDKLYRNMSGGLPPPTWD